MAATNYLVAGSYFMWVATRDSNGYAKGTNVTPDTAATNTTYSPYRVKHPISFTPAQPTYETAQRFGGQGYRGQRDLGISDLGTAQIVLDSFDEGFHALVSGTLVDTSTLSAWNITTAADTEPIRPQLIVGLTAGATTEAGTDEFLTIIFHNATIRPSKVGFSQSGGQNPNPTTYDLVPNVSTRSGIARLISAMALGLVENSDTCMQIRYTDPIHLSTYIGDNSATSFVLPYRPTSSDATGAASNSITAAGATLAVTSVSTTTGVVTFASAPASGAIVQVAFPTRYVAI